MMSNDPVDRALSLLRDETALPAPDQALEARLKAQHPSRTRRRRLRRLPLVLAALGVSAAAAAASGGVDWVRSWWFVVDVDGQELSIPLEDGEPAVVDFETADGGVGRVRVQRDVDEDGAQRTRIAIDSHSVGRVESEELEESTGHRPEKRFPLSEVDDALSLYAGHDGRGRSFEFFADTRGGEGSRLLVLQDDGSDLPVIEVARLPFDILSPGAHAEFTELGAGVLSLSLTDGRGGAIEFSWVSGAPSSEPGVSELEAVDGAVRVRVEGASDGSSSTDS